MSQPVCIYTDQSSATAAATLARKKGATAHVRVKSLERMRDKPLFVIETGKNEQQMVIDSIADGSKVNPSLSDSALRCPNCNSIRLEFPVRPRVSPTMRGLSEFIEFLARFFGFPTDNRFHCRKCGHSCNARQVAGMSTVTTDRKAGTKLAGAHNRSALSG